MSELRNFPQTDLSSVLTSSFVHDLIQQHVVEYFGYRDVNALRTALFRFPDDPVVQAAFYGRL